MDQVFDWKWLAGQGIGFFFFAVILYMYHALTNRVLDALGKNTEAMTHLSELIKQNKGTN